jgi:nickel transport system ATP-binding protein
LTETLTIENLHIAARHGDHDHVLVDGISLTIRRGRILALVGSSGCGKSMTCSGAQGVLPPGVRVTRGQVLYDGRPIAPDKLRGHVVATIMQNPRSAFNPVRTMADHAKETLRAVGKLDAAWRSRVLEALATVGLEDGEKVLGLHAFEMSGGMLQRAMIALALLSDAPFLFADEPTTDLDLIVQARILDLLDDLARRRNLGVLMITHDMGVVARLADEVAVMENGRIIEQATTRDIFDDPQRIATRELVEAHMALYPEVA